MDAPIPDPWPAGPHRPPRGRLSSAVRTALVVTLVLGPLALTAVVLLARPTPHPASTLTVRPGPSMFTVVRDIARLETTEIHVERVIDLTDRQSRLFGLVEATDAILLVAVGQVTLGVDLSKLTEGDVSMDHDAGVATLTLPEPEVFSTRLDEEHTYVYTRTTSLLAKRNERLETRARQEAIRAIQKAADEGDTFARARAQAERQLTALATQLGAGRVEIRWRPAR